MSDKYTLRLLLLVSDMRSGGAERVAATLANGWSSRGARVHLVATYSQFRERELPLSVDVEFACLADSPGCIGRSPIAYLRRLRRLRELIRRTRPDVIVSFLTNVNIFGLVASAGCGVPVIVSERVDPASETEFSRTLKVLRWAVYPFADVIAVQTQRAATGMAARIACSPGIVVIPNPLPPELAQARRQASPSNERRLVVAAGRLTAQKRFDVLIDAFALLANRFPQWDLRIWGEGELSTTLQDRVEKGGMSHRVVLAGQSGQLWHELGKADAFVLSSDFEGFPNVLLEAMALGIACVATDCASGPRELSRNGEVALLVPAGRPDAMASALERLMTDGNLRAELGQKAAEFVSEEFNLTAVLRQWDQVFSRVRP